MGGTSITQQTQDVLALRGQDLMSQDGDKLGTIEEIYLDTETNQPEWALIATGLFGSKQSFVPISGAGREDDAARDTDGPAISEEEHEIVLHEEEPVVEKQAVPKERVRLDKEAHTDERQVSDTLRKEEIEVDDARGAR
jgi:hypothetical protein